MTSLFYQRFHFTCSVWYNETFFNAHHIHITPIIGNETNNDYTQV